MISVNTTACAHDEWSPGQHCSLTLSWHLNFKFKTMVIAAGEYASLSHDMAFGQARSPLDDVLRVYHLAINDDDGADKKLQHHKQRQRLLQEEPCSLAVAAQRATEGRRKQSGMYHMSESVLVHVRTLTVAAIAVSTPPPS